MYEELHIPWYGNDSADYGSYLSQNNVTIQILFFCSDAVQTTAVTSVTMANDESYKGSMIKLISKSLVCEHEHAAFISALGKRLVGITMEGKFHYHPRFVASVSRQIQKPLCAHIP